MKQIIEQGIQLENTCVAFGYFDGVHIGHDTIVKKLAQEAEKGLTPVVVSFNATDGDKKLCTEAEKAFLLKDMPGEMLSWPVAAGYKPDETFVRNILLEQLGAKVVVVGENCETLPVLRSFANAGELTVVVCPTVCLGGKPATSDWATQLLADCNMDLLTQLLGHPYLILGKVVEGKQLGRTVGMPTANIEYFEEKQIPAQGVYATVTRVDEKLRKSLTNIGKRPSVDNFDYLTVECYIMDFSGDLYGQILPIEIHSFIRGVKKFSNLGEVKDQVGWDIEAVRAQLNALVE